MSLPRRPLTQSFDAFLDERADAAFQKLQAKDLALFEDQVLDQSTAKRLFWRRALGDLLRFAEAGAVILLIAGFGLVLNKLLGLFLG
ncbi:MAG: hypothetical protein ACPGNV_15225 [Mangrovicoccus sp.]